MRSPPLIVDKETGEPRNPPITYKKWEAWKVIVVDQVTGKRATKKFFSYSKAKEKVAELRERYGDRVWTGVVSRQVGYGPPYSKLSDDQLLYLNENGKWWCPYCRTLREFYFMPACGQRVCEFCHTREKDFHVVKCNPILWSSEKVRREIG